MIYLPSKSTPSAETGLHTAAEVVAEYFHGTLKYVIEETQEIEEITLQWYKNWYVEWFRGEFSMEMDGLGVDGWILDGGRNGRKPL